MSSDAVLLESMEKDLRLAGKAERTVEAYTGAVRRLVRRTGKPLGEIEEDDVREVPVGDGRQQGRAGYLLDQSVWHSVLLDGHPGVGLEDL